MFTDIVMFTWILTLTSVTDTHRHAQTHTDTHIHTQTNTQSHYHTLANTHTHTLSLFLSHTHTHTLTHTHTHSHSHTLTHTIPFSRTRNFMEKIAAFKNRLFVRVATLEHQEIFIVAFWSKSFLFCGIPHFIQNAMPCILSCLKMPISTQLQKVFN